MPTPPEFNMYSDPGLIEKLGWERLREIMEQNAAQLRTMSFIRPDWILLLQRKGAISPHAKMHILRIASEAGTLELVPAFDTNGYRSVYFRFAQGDYDGNTGS